MYRMLKLTRTAGAFFTTYEGVKSVVNKLNGSSNGSSGRILPQPVIDGAASSVAELVSCLILTPAEVVKQNAQMVRRSKDGTPKGGKSPTLEVIKHFKKPSQLFRGYTALAARNLPFTAMQFPMFEHLKRTIREHRKQKGTATGTLLETSLITAVSAGSAGSVAAVITTPIDVVKTRIMLSAGEDGDAKAGNRKSGLTVAKEVLKESGVKGLFRGGALRGVWTALGSGLYLGVYESGRVYLGDRRKAKAAEMGS
jgi:solute carrier family 25 S-adenosylmethionine transporter 26